MNIPKGTIKAMRKAERADIARRFPGPQQDAIAGVIPLGSQYSQVDRNSFGSIKKGRK